jgi:hypothetical protein
MVFEKEQALECLSKTPIAFIGKMTEVIPGISTRSMPPTNHYKLRFQQIQHVRGTVSATEFSYHQRGAGLLDRENNHGHGHTTKEPTVGMIYLACSSDGQHINSLVELDNHMIEQILHSSAVPLGWNKLSNGRLESPWQHSHAKHAKWYDHPRYGGIEKCAVTGRPVLVTTDDISLACEPVPPVHLKEYQNPDGDGMIIESF